MGHFVPNPRFPVELVIDPEFQAAMEGIGREALEETKQRAPVATGALRDSLQVERLNNGGRRVEATVDYATFVEFGTSDTPAQPFLRPTLTALGLRVTR